MGDLIQFTPPREAAPAEEQLIEWQRLAVCESIATGESICLDKEDPVWWFATEMCAQCDKPIYIYPFHWTEKCLCFPDWNRRETATGNQLTSVPGVYLAAKRIPKMTFGNLIIRLRSFAKDPEAQFYAAMDCGALEDDDEEEPEIMPGEDLSP